MTGGLIIVVLVVFMAVAAPLVDHIDHSELSPIDRLQAPSGFHWFGTDELGRDIYSRTIHGSRISLLVGFVVAGIVAMAGSALGLVSGYYRGLDNVIMRFMDGIMAIPAILLALALVAMLGGSVQNVIIAISVVETPRMVRIVRASVLSLREQEFVTAIRAVGAGPLRILARHVFPNTLAPLLIQGTFVFAFAVIVEASLSFLGAGVPPDVPSWGNMMGRGKTYIELAFWWTFFPGLFLSITVLAVNLLGDGLRDALDPKLRRRG